MATLQGTPLALVVDDDPVTRALVARALRELGCRSVLQAPDGLAARAQLQERPEIDLVLTDILMPGLDGLELLRWGRDHLPETIWIILSGLDTFDSAVEAIRLGASDFLAKPPRIPELNVAVENALERRALRVERDRLHLELKRRNEELAEKLEELERKSELLRRDLERAEVIQRALLPSTPPPLERYCVHARYRPGHHVGGDLYDVARIDERHVALYVADATGHGVTAAMLSVLFKHHLLMHDARTGRPLGPAAVLQAVNRALHEAVATPGLFLTAVYCLLDLAEGRLRLASAGHPPVLHVRAGGETRWIVRTGPALGLTPVARFGEEDLRLEQGDRLLLYTDGLSPSGDLLESDGVPALLRRHGADGERAVSALLDRVEQEAGAEDRDDVTVVLLEARSGRSGFDNGTADATREAPALQPTLDAAVRYGDTEEAAYLALRGRLTWMSCGTLYETGCAILSAGRPLVLDLADCDYLDSTCLGTIHDLVGRGARLQGVPERLRALFEEFSMDQVVGRIEEESAPLPEMYPLAALAGGPEVGRRRIAEAHQALAALSDRNRETFAALLEGLGRRGGGGGGDRPGD